MSGNIKKAEQLLVSVIIPVFNRENTIVACVDSVLAQSYSDFELLLVDDGSTDSSGLVCDQCALLDDRVRTIHIEHRGPSGARNAGIDAARGDLVMFCDSDDVVEPDWISVLSDCMKDEDVILSVSNYWLMGSRGEKTKFSSRDSCWFSLEDYPLMMRKCGLKSIWHCCYRVSDARFDESFSFGEDVVFNWSYVCQFMDSPRSKIRYVDSPLYCYSASTRGSLTKSMHDSVAVQGYSLACYRLFAAQFYYSESANAGLRKEISLCETNLLIQQAVKGEIALSDLKERMGSSEWDDYLQTLLGSPNYRRLCQSRSPFLLMIYHRLYLPFRYRFG